MARYTFSPVDTIEGHCYLIVIDFSPEDEQARWNTLHPLETLDLFDPPAYCEDGAIWLFASADEFTPEQINLIKGLVEAENPPVLSA